MILPLTGMILPLTGMILPLTGMILPLTGMILPLTGKMHFFDFLIKIDLINFNLMAKGTKKNNLVIEVTKGPEILQ
jgi:hypothetical protein